VAQPIDRLARFDPVSAGAARPRAQRYVLLDVFTDTPLQGNQLAVFTDARGIASAQMQSLARELRLSETVFLLPPEGEADLAIRIFTPEAELPFAGHPVLGSAIVVAGALLKDSVTLETGMGPVTVRVRREGTRAVSGWMRQPIPTWEPYAREGELLGALSLERSGLPVEVYDNGPRHVYVELGSLEAVAALAPDQQALSALGEVCVSCFAGAGRHWKTRMFAPSLGVAEDPATGSAAGPLALHLVRHGRIDFGEEIEISQGSEISRPSLLYAFASGSGSGSAVTVQSVEVGGSAVIVAQGEFLLG
jgi:trans-2,3-dihydro-3-hydroxyanthranilate isomerase